MERDIVDIVVDNINRYLKEKNMKQWQLEVEVGTATIQKIMNKNTKHGCGIRTLQRIAIALDVKTIDLVEDWSEEWCIIFEWVDSLLSLKYEIDDLFLAIQINKNELKRWSNYKDGNDGNLAKQHTFLTAIRKQDELKEVISELQKRLQEKEAEKKGIIELVDKFKGLDQQILKLKYTQDMTLEAIADELGYSYQYIKNKHAEIMRIISFSKKV